VVSRKPCRLAARFNRQSIALPTVNRAYSQPADDSRLVRPAQGYLRTANGRCESQLRRSSRIAIGDLAAVKSCTD
jgi:hypothetical protein